MRRRSLHVAFAAASLIAAGVAGGLGLQWQQARQVNAAIETAGNADAALASQAGPEGQLTHALALSSKGSADAAIRIYKTLAQGEREDIRQAALYDLGNLYLREALKDGPGEAMRYLPLIELAKQSYRSVLRADSDDWDARHNLELALRLAPDQDEQPVEDPEALVPKERAITTMQGRKLVLP